MSVWGEGYDTCTAASLRQSAPHTLAVRVERWGVIKKYLGVCVFRLYGVWCIEQLANIIGCNVSTQSFHIDGTHY